MKSTVLFLLLMFCTQAFAGAEPTLESRAHDVSHLFNANPASYEQIFAPSFRSAVPDAKLAMILKDVFNKAGACKSIAPDKDEAGAFVFTFEKGFSTTVHLAIDANPPHLVTGFFIGPLHAHAASYDDLILQLKKLPGSTSLLVAQLNDSDFKPLAQHNTDQPLAIGSAFKLYVLAALVSEIETGHRHLDDVVHLTEDARSVPSGLLQDWPIGSPITLHTLASLMISKSDNTAADQLIATLSRAKVEQMLTTTGNANFALDQPFLTTLEWAKLKGDPTGKAADLYLAASLQDRRTMLAHAIAKMRRDGIESWDTPRRINDIEWFASTADLAHVMRWIKLHTEKSPAADARGILSINPGLDLSKKQWDYIGYKGGSEPGVLNLTFLLRSAAGDRWFVVSGTWNNPDKILDETEFEEIVRQAIELIR